MPDLILLLVEWLVVFVINVVPAFAPPTWIVLAYFYINSSQNILLLVLIGVTASTAGRFVLAKFSGIIVERFGNKKMKEDMKEIRKFLNPDESRKVFFKRKKFYFTFLYSLSPLPSNTLFIAVGSAKLKMKDILLGFFLGRTCSYFFLVFTTNEIYQAFSDSISGTGSLLTYTIEFIGIIGILAFFLIDWSKYLKKFDSQKKRKK